MAWSLTLHANRSADNTPLCSFRTDGSHTVTSKVAIQEARTYWWLLKGDVDDPFTSRLTIDGVVLSREIVSKSEIWFAWPIGFNAGVAGVTVSVFPFHEHAFELIIDPAKDKLIRQDFRIMLREIFADTKSLAALAGFSTTTSARGNIDLPIAKIEFILEAVPVLSRLVSELNRTHRTRLRRQPKAVALSRARNVTGMQLRKGLTTGTRSWDTTHQVGNELKQFLNRTGGQLPVTITTSQPVHSPNIREHAEIAGFLGSLVSLLRKTSASLLKQHPEEKLLTARVTRATRLLGALRREGIFNAVMPVSGRWQHSHLYERTEPYRSIYKVYRDVTHGIEGIEGDHTKISLQQTHRLYETWVALRFARAAASIDPNVDPSSLFVDSVTKDGLRFTLDNTSVPFRGGLMLFKPIFNEIWLTESNRGSYTRQMIPDLVLDFTERESLHKHFIVLDSKYRIEAQLNDAVSSLHMYKDSIVEKAESETVLPLFKRLVSASYIVTPSSPRSFDAGADWRSHTMPEVIFYHGYQSEFRLGGLALKPGVETKVIADILVNLLNGEPASPLGRAN